MRGPGVPVGEFISVAPPSVKRRQDVDGGRLDKRRAAGFICALTVPLQNLRYLLRRYHERARAAAAVEFTGGSARVFLEAHDCGFTGADAQSESLRVAASIDL